MLPILAVCLVSCEKDNKELSGDDIIPFKDENFLKALLTVQEIEIYDDEPGDYVSYIVDVDENKDGQISVNEAKDVKGLLLNDSETFQPFNVTDIAEIKYFTALTYLSCERNLLTTLDVSGCQALVEFFCEDNPLSTLTISASQQNASWLNDVKSDYPDIEIIVK